MSIDVGYSVLIFKTHLGYMAVLYMFGHQTHTNYRADRYDYVRRWARTQLQKVNKKTPHTAEYTDMEDIPYLHEVWQ